MNIYINPDLYKEETYAGHLKKAMENSEDIFNKEKILAFSDAYDLLSEENKALALEACDAIAEDAAYVELCRAMLYFMEKDLPIGLLKPQGEDIRAEFALFFPLLNLAERFAEDARRRGISEKILRDSLKGIDSCITRNADFTGRIGTSAYHEWLPLFGQGRLFTMADFQFELREFQGKNAIGVHIPKGTKLCVEANLKSFKTAMDFFVTYYPEYEAAGLVCESWLMNPKIEEIMGKKTNISRFGDMFDRFDIGDTVGKSVYRFVFGVLKPANPDSLCGETSLQRAFKAYLKTGGKIVNYGGYISAEKLNEMLKSYGG